MRLTTTNVLALARHFAGAEVMSNDKAHSAARARHLHRCADAGLMTIAPHDLRLTDEGRAAIAALPPSMIGNG